MYVGNREDRYAWKCTIGSTCRSHQIQTSAKQNRGDDEVNNVAKELALSRLGCFQSDLCAVCIDTCHNRLLGHALLRLEGVLAGQLVLGTLTGWNSIFALDDI